MEITDTQMIKKMDLVLDEISSVRVDVKELSSSLTDHRERHAMVMDMLMTSGKLIVGIATFLTMIGGAIFGFYSFIKGGN